MRISACLLVALALPARADDLDDRLASVRVLLEAEDTASRDKGEELLMKLAAEAGARLKPLMEHPDAEVRARVSRVLERAQIIPEDGKTEQLHALFEKLATPGKPDETRVKVVREIFELHPKTPAFVARELRDGQLDWIAVPARVVPRGKVTATFEVENAGDCGAWILPSRWYALPNLKPFGERPGRLTMHSGAIGAQIALLRHGESPEDAMIRALASMTRIPKGGRANLVSGAGEAKTCGTFTFRAQAIGCSPRNFEAAFAGITLVFPTGELATSITATRYVLGESAGKCFKAVPYEAGGERGLDVTAQEDAPAMKKDGMDAYWWVALDAEGMFLDEGAFETDEADLAALKKDETRRVKMRGGLPAGTKTLWMGITVGEDECVPAPVELGK